MKTLLIAVLAIVAILVVSNVVMAEEYELNTSVTSLVTKNDKNGNEYTRVIITEQREKNGIPYPKTLAVMFFGEHNARAKTLSVGDKIHGVAEKSLYQGSESYVWLGWAE